MSKKRFRSVSAAACATVLAMVWATASVRAQSAPADDGGMMAKDGDPGWEAATVKPADPDAKSSTISINGRHIVIVNQPVEAMLKFAYTVQSGNQLVDEPQWMKTERWDVSGVPDLPGKPNLPQFQSMMRKLLEDRFGLKLHKEQRDMPVFALRVAKGGPKQMEKSANQSLGPGNNGSGAGGIESHHYTNTAMPDLALMLMVYGDRPVVDQTGMQGRYDFDLRWTKDATRTTDPDAPPELFTAIHEQIGLKLEAAKAPADVVVIDSVKRPGGN